jgi:hypothetical protein
VPKAYELQLLPGCGQLSFHFTVVIIYPCCFLTDFLTKLAGNSVRDLAEMDAVHVLQEGNQDIEQ